MKHPIRTALLAGLALVATSAFAAETAKVNIPFSFTSHGVVYPAGQYVATLDMEHNILALRSATDASVSARWVVGPAESDPENPMLTLKFDGLGESHTLHSVQLGSRITSRLDAPSHYRELGKTTSVSGTVSGQ